VVAPNPTGIFPTIYPPLKTLEGKSLRRESPNWLGKKKNLFGNPKVIDYPLKEMGENPLDVKKMFFLGELEGLKSIK